jgi:hypothetical protein
MPTNADDNPELHDVVETLSKKPYTKPELVIHGTVETITGSSTGSGTTYDFENQIARRSK